MNKDLSNKRIVITGITGGIAKASAQRLAAEGAEIIVTARSEEKLEKSLADISGNVSGYVMDLQDEESVKTFFSRVGDFDHLVTPAASSMFAPIREMDFTAARELIETKQWGQMMCVHYALPYLSKNGSITLFSGTVTQKPLPGATMFAKAARRAVDAGLDGVEIHGANGFLVDQFTRDGINQREDEYGGSIDNRLRFMMEVVDAVCNEIGSGKVGIRISPTNKVWGIKDSDPKATFTRAVTRLNDFNLAYVHILEPKPNSGHPVETVDYLTPVLRQSYQGNLILNGGYSKDSANDAIASKEAEAIGFGTPFIANPDLVERFQKNAQLAQPDSTTFYTPGAKGYTDYPSIPAEK